MNNIKENKNIQKENKNNKGTLTNEEQHDVIDNRNVWIAIKCDRVLMYTIGLQHLLY